MNSSTSSASVNNDELDIGQIIRSVWNGKWIIIATTIVTTFFGVAYAIMATPIYTGNSLMQIEAKASGFAGLSGLAEAFGGGGGGGGDTTTELEILKSRKVILPTVEKFSLEIRALPNTFPLIGGYFYRKYIGQDGFRKPLFADLLGFTKDYAWGGEQIIVNQFNVPQKYRDAEFDIIILGDDKFSLHLKDNKILEGKVGVPQHNDQWGIDIQLGKLEGRIGTYFTLERLSQILVIDDLVKNLGVTENGSSSGIIVISMQGTDKKKIKYVIDDILTTYQQQNVEYNSVEAGRSLDFVKKQLPEITQNLKDAEQNIYEYRLNNKTVDLTLQTGQLLSQLLAIEESLNELNLQEPELSRKFKLEHPIYIEFLRKKADLEKKRDDVNEQTGQIPEDQFNIFRLQRDVQLSQKIYLQMLNRFEELKIIKAGALGSIRIIDKTVVYPYSIKPQKINIVVAAIMVGLVLSIAFIVLRSVLSKGIKSADQLKEMGYKVYATIPLSAIETRLHKKKAKFNKVKVLSHLHPKEPAVEAMRSLRTNLHFAMTEAKNNIIMITGPSPDIGKCFVSQNLAVLIAQSDLKVLLVDIDMRRGSVHENFGLDNKRGFSDYLSGGAEFDDVCQETKIKGLDVITCGNILPNPSELLMGKRFEEFCETYKDKYDFIILDTPPVLAVSDAIIVGKIAGTSMMVVKQTVSHVKEIELATQKLNLMDIEVKGYVFNGVNKKHNTADNYQYSYS